MERASRAALCCDGAQLERRYLPTRHPTPTVPLVGVLALAAVMRRDLAASVSYCSTQLYVPVVNFHGEPLIEKEAIAIVRSSPARARA